MVTKPDIELFTQGVPSFKKLSLLCRLSGAYLDILQCPGFPYYRPDSRLSLWRHVFFPPQTSGTGPSVPLVSISPRPRCPVCLVSGFLKDPDVLLLNPGIADTSPRALRDPRCPLTSTSRCETSAFLDQFPQPLCKLSSYWGQLCGM